MTAGNSDDIARACLNRLAIRYRFLETAEASTDCVVFGRPLKTPIMLGGMAHYEQLHPSGAEGYAHAAREAGTAIWTGFMEDEPFERVLAAGAPAARILKPFRNRDLLLRAMEHDAAHGACAFCIDIDHVYDKRGHCGAFAGEALQAPDRAGLEELARHTRLSFFVKGVLSVEDAELCVLAGVSGIVASQHQNLFPWCVPPVAQLPKLREAVGDALTILCDSCLDDGYAAFKALALGADAVFTVRQMIPVFREEGPQGVRERVEKMTDELRACLSRTGSKDIRSIRPNTVELI